MTEKLKNLMDEVTGMVDHDFVTPDLDAIVRNGDRSLRRRRLVVGGAALALVAAVSTGVVLFDDNGDGDAGFANDSFDTDVPMWTQGRTLHIAGRTYDLGVGVTSLVRTSAGIAFVGEDKGIYTFAGGEPDRIGTAADVEVSPLVGDSDGDWVGWISDAGDQREYVAHDVVSGEEVRDAVKLDPDAQKPLDTGYFLAIDGSTAYRLDARGTLRTDLSSGESTAVGPADDPTLVIAAENGLIVTWIETKSGADIGTDVVDGGGHVVLGHEGGRTVGALSPDGTWAAGLGSGLVWEVGTGRQVALDTGGPGDAAGYDWLDDDTLMVVAEGSHDAVRLLECEVPTGSCAEVTQLDVSSETVALPSFGLFSAMQFGGVSTSSSSSATEEASTAPSEAASTVRP